MGDPVRVTSAIRCVDCGATNAYERRAGDETWELYCPDCGAVFGWGNLPTQCLDCRKPLRDAEDRGRGLCSSCRIARWSPEKRAAMNKLIGLAFKPGGATEAEKDAAIDEAFKHPLGD